MISLTPSRVNGKHQFDSRIARVEASIARRHGTKTIRRLSAKLQCLLDRRTELLPDTLSPTGVAA
jgi:hypothetical protein